MLANLRRTGVHIGRGATLTGVPKQASTAFPDRPARYVALPQQPAGQPLPRYGPALTAQFPNTPIVVMYGSPYRPLDPLPEALPALPWLFAACVAAFLILSVRSARRPAGAPAIGTPARLAALTGLAVEMSVLPHRDIEPGLTRHTLRPRGGRLPDPGRLGAVAGRHSGRPDRAPGPVVLGLRGARQRSGPVGGGTGHREPAAGRGAARARRRRPAGGLRRRPGGRQGPRAGSRPPSTNGIGG